MNKVLINVSNHPSEKWSAAQRAAWTTIIDVAFPNVPATASALDVAVMAEELREQIGRLMCVMYDEDEFPNLMIQGEFTLVNLLTRTFNRCLYWTPSSDRASSELPDGKKVSTFVFKGWRGIKVNEHGQVADYL